ncbi:MAG: helix-turn-helix domain-containing protein [Flavobacteriales bacterium]|jgi:AraC-like DNA-binding protein|nr:helix-turn-helix domain-containing protein [Flavobacteriales bacterium]
MRDIIHIENLHDIHESLGIHSPKHPLVSVIDFNSMNMAIDAKEYRYTLGLYQISIKGNCAYTISKYGRNTYDFQECSVIFTAPHQVLEFNSAYQSDDKNCWTLLFHPNLIRASELGKKIDAFPFFDYACNESLHLSKGERETITEITYKIKEEYSNNIDMHSQTLIIANIELLLNYCIRFYDRQFYTRTNFNKDLVSVFEQLLKTYYKTEKQLKIGLPTVQYCANEMGMSPKYLSELLRKETGKSTQDHIHSYIVEMAKQKLLNTQLSASEIAYSLGFDYPQYFSKMFKRLTNKSPIEYRKIK